MATAISWTNETWNPVTGCSRISDGCRNCYAERLSLEKGWSKLPWTFANVVQNIVLHPDRLRKPYSYKPGARCFVNSMSDLFHDAVPDDFIAQIFAVMADNPQVTFQCLTKRPERAANWNTWPANVWMGTSIEDNRVAGRADNLRECGAAIKFLSIEPLLGPVDQVELTGIDWVIVGGESGPGFRKLQMEWARDLRDRCENAGIAFFFKQDSAYRTETRTYIVEPDGSHTTIQQYPERPHEHSETTRRPISKAVTAEASLF